MAVEANNASAIIDLARTHGACEGIDLTDVPGGPKVLSVPVGRSVMSIKKLIDEYAERPDRKTGTAELQTLASFCEFVNLHKDDHTVVFADVANRKAPAMLAVLDYHDDKGPRFGAHRARYAFPVSEEWTAWMLAAEKQFTQADFAAFMEDRVPDVAPPESAVASVQTFAGQIGIKLATAQQLMNLSRELSIKATQKVKSATNLSSGEATVAFEEEHQDGNGGSVKVPGGFALQIPVFRGGVSYQVPVRLRYRIQGGQVIWSFKLSRIDPIWDDAVTESCNTVVEKTTVQLFRGLPERG